MAAPSMDASGASLADELDSLKFGEETVEETDFGSVLEDLERFQQDSLVRKALVEGVDLRQYRESVESDLRQAESETVSTYVAEEERVTRLFKELQQCDTVLSEMQELLLGFQADLGGISSEITHLRRESMAMDVKLRNRRDVEERLKAFLEKVVLPPDLAHAITDGDINTAYIEYITALSEKIAYISQRQAPEDNSSMGLAPAKTAAAAEVGPFLTRLRSRASPSSSIFTAAATCSARSASCGGRARTCT